MKLPHGEQADPGTKLEDYSLNPLHRHGQHKARVFESVLGITLANAGVLRDALKQAAATSGKAVARATTATARFMNCAWRCPPFRARPPS